MKNVSLNLHGHLRLTLIDASPMDVRAVVQAIGAQIVDSDVAADLEIRFIQNQQQLVNWRKQVGHEAWNSQRHFTIEDAKGKLPVEVSLPTDQQSSELFRTAYPSGIRRLPLLRSLVNMKSTEKGWLGIHGTAFTHNDRGYLVCGGSGGGKTGTLLAYLMQGAQYLAAEWAYLSEEGRVIHGVPETLRLRDWHVQNAGNRLANIGLGDRIQLAKWRYAAKGLQPICQMLETVSEKQGRRLRHFAGRVDRQRYIDCSVDNWLGKSASPRAAILHNILLVSTHAHSEIRVEQIGINEAIRRLTELQDADAADLLAAHRRCTADDTELPPRLQNYITTRTQLIDQFVAGKNVYAVSRPQDVNLSELYHAIESVTEEVCLLSH